MMPGGGVEPRRPEGRRILSPLRLPVPPSRLGREVENNPKANGCFPVLQIAHCNWMNQIRRRKGALSAVSRTPLLRMTVLDSFRSLTHQPSRMIL